MPLEFTKRVRAVKQEPGTNRNVWGDELNEGAIDQFDGAWGTVEITVSEDVSLAVDEGLPDQARSFVVRCTGPGGFAVSTPSSVDKPYIVDNQCAADITFGPSGGAKATVRAGVRSVVITNAAGTVAYAVDPTLDKIKPPVASVDMGGQKLTNAAPGTANTDVATLAQLKPFADAAAESADEAAATLVLVEALYVLFGDLFLGAKASDPTTDNQGDPLVTGTLYFNTTANELRVFNGTLWQGGVTDVANLVAKWTYSTITSNTTAVNGTAYIANTAGGGFTLTLPASAAAGVRVGVIAPSSVETNALTINPNGQTFDGATTSFTVGAPCTLVFVKIGTEWRLEP